MCGLFCSKGLNEVSDSLKQRLEGGMVMHTLNF